MYEMYCSLNHTFTPCLNKLRGTPEPSSASQLLNAVRYLSLSVHIICAVNPWHGPNPPRCTAKHMSIHSVRRRVSQAGVLSKTPAFRRPSVIDTRVNRVLRVINVTRLPSALNVPRQPTTAHLRHFSVTTSSK